MALCTNHVAIVARKAQKGEIKLTPSVMVTAEVVAAGEGFSWLEVIMPVKNGFLGGISLLLWVTLLLTCKKVYKLFFRGVK